MANKDADSAESELAFTKVEWDAAMPALTLAMKEVLKRYRTPIFIDHGDHGEPHGSGFS